MAMQLGGHRVPARPALPRQPVWPCRRADRAGQYTLHGLSPGWLHARGSSNQARKRRQMPEISCLQGVDAPKQQPPLAAMPLQPPTGGAPAATRCAAEEPQLRPLGTNQCLCWGEGVGAQVSGMCRCGLWMLGVGSQTMRQVQPQTPASPHSPDC